MLHDVEVFADPWEHVQMLSDRHRCEVIATLLRRRAHGARVLEIGSGTGLWACMAARLGASRVLAVEPTPTVELVRQLVAHNGLANRVEVVEASIEELTPEPMDLVFSELLNILPFAEGILPVSAVARDWLAPGGHLAPDRLQVLIQPARVAAIDRNLAKMASILDGIEGEAGLDLTPLRRFLDTSSPDLSHGSEHTLVGPPQLVWDLDLRGGATPDARALDLEHSAPANGVVVWFRARYDRDLWLDNQPGERPHWGQLVATFSGSSQALRIRVEADEDSLEIARLGAR